MGLFDGEAALVVGSVVGIRTFHTSAKGYLLPPSYESGVSFVDGVNYARCGYMGYRTPWNVTTYGNPPKRLDERDPFFYNHRQHPIASKACSCGFYAFRTYTRSIISGYPNSQSVQAIVEGFGHVTVGTEGFRAEKLRIKAIVVPSEPRFNWFSRFSDRYVGSSWHLALLLIGMAILFFNVVANFLWYDDWFGDDAPWVSWGVLFVGMLPTWFNMAAIRYKKRYAGTTAQHQRREYFRKTLPLIQERYPSVEVYTDYKKALKAHPVSNFNALAKDTDQKEKLND